MRRSHRGRSTLTPQTYLARPPWRYAWPGRRCWASAKGGRRAHRTACGRARQDAHSRDRSAVSKKCACTLHSATPRPDFPPRKMKCADDVYRNAHHSFIHHNPQMEIAPEVWPRGGGGLEDKMQPVHAVARYGHRCPRGQRRESAYGTGTTQERNPRGPNNGRPCPGAAGRERAHRV